MRNNPSSRCESGTNALGRAAITLAGVIVLAAAALASVAAAAPGATCGICGKNLIKNPSAEAGAGITAVGAFGAVPGWTNEARHMTNSPCAPYAVEPAS